MKLTKEQLQEVITTIYARMAEGKMDDEIMVETGLAAEDYRKLKAAMFDQKADEIRARPTEHTYIQYMIDQAQNVKALSDMIEEFKTTKQYNAMVGAIRARSEIYDKLIDKGQEFGLIHREPDKKIVGGFVVADLSNKQLKTMITGELQVLDKLMRRYGDRNILDMVPGSLHRGPAMKEATNDSAVVVSNPKETISKTSKSKNHRRSGGRKVVKKVKAR